MSYHEHWADAMNLDEEAYEDKLVEIKARIDELRILLSEAPSHEMRDIMDEIKGLERMINCRCDGYDICNPCLNMDRRERYGDNIHDVDCACNECNGYGYTGADY